MYLPARPRFEIVVGTASAAERRLVSVATVRALTGLSDDAEDGAPDATVELWIDAALAQCATSCKLARAGNAPLTLAQETVRATWPARSNAARSPTTWFLDEGHTQLLLPWRAPISSIDITEGDADLEENVDYQLLGAGVVQRLTGGCWALGEIVADYTAGWVAPAEDPSAEPVDGETMPADLVALVADQVMMKFDALGMDQNLRSEDVPGIWSGSYNVPGGDSIDTSGLSRPLWDALSPFRAPPSFA